MLYTRLFLLICLTALTGCRHEAVDLSDPGEKADAPCACPFLNAQPTYKINQTPDSLTQYYLGVWQREFIRRNHIDDATFQTKIRFVSGNLISWREGVSFRIDYTYQQDWLTVYHYEQLRVNYDPATTASYAITVPRGVYLKEGQLLFREPWDENTEPINLNSKLAFSSCEAACSALRTKTKASVLNPDRISFFVPGTIPRIPGDPYLFSYGTIDSAGNRCIQGQINLVTGNAQATETPCYINLR